MSVKTITVQESKVIRIYTCDHCGKESEHFNQPCMICGRGVCRKCRWGINEWECTLTDKSPSFGGDYPLEYICIECWEKGIAFRREIQTVRCKAEYEEGRLWEEWKQTRREEVRLQAEKLKYDAMPV